MSWLRDWENRLVNLEDVRKIEVSPTSEEEEKDFTHGVFGYSIQDDDSDQPSYCFSVGSEEACHAFFERLAGKLPVVKP